MNETLNCFMAAICRDMVEGGDGTKYFGSLGAFKSHQQDAITCGLLTPELKITVMGHLVGKACANLPPGRAYVYSEEYVKAANNALKDFNKDDVDDKTASKETESKTRINRTKT